MKTNRPLHDWLTAQTDLVCTNTMYNLPNRLTDREDITAYLHLLAKHADNKHGISIGTLQRWVQEHIGDDDDLARDWLLAFRVLKSELSGQLSQAFTISKAIKYWWKIDDILTDSIIEVTLLESENGRSQTLAHITQLQTQIEQLEESKTNFISVAAHELRTPLTILEGYTNMLRAELADDSPLNIYVNGLNNGLTRLNGTIGDMIDISLMDLHSFELNYQQVNLENHLILITDQLKRFYEPRHITLQVEPFDKLYRAYIDAPRLSKAIKKILMNALKFTPDRGSVIIRGYASQENEAYRNKDTGTLSNISEYIHIAINDNGIGIGPENLDRIFRTFGSLGDAKLHSSGTTKFKGGGAGLGLSITRGIIEAHNGRIWAESDGYDENLCPGSTFHIELPIYKNAPETY